MQEKAKRYYISCIHEFIFRANYDVTSSWALKIFKKGNQPVVVFFLTMLAEMLHHPPQHQRHTILHQALLLQLKQGHSKQLGVLDCPGSQHGYLDHLLHVFFNLHCCLVVLQGGEQTAAVSCRHYGHRGQRWSCIRLDTTERPVLEETGSLYSTD